METRFRYRFLSNRRPAFNPRSGVDSRFGHCVNVLNGRFPPPSSPVRVPNINLNVSTLFLIQLRLTLTSELLPTFY